MTLDFPLWLIVVILGVEGWPIVLIFGLVLGVLAVMARGWVRGVAIVLVLPCAALLATAVWWGLEDRQRDRDSAAFEARTHEMLDRDRVVDGVAFPAGTEMVWTDVGRTRLRSASPPESITMFGARVDWVSHADFGPDWDVQLVAPAEIEGWSCAKVGVRLSSKGRLLSCRLAAGRLWRGWPIPADCPLDLTAEDGAVRLALPIGSSMAAPEIGHALTATGGFTLNADGSLRQFYFEPEDPLLVGGKQLWNTVEWSYDPATLGQGRKRRAVTVSGALGLLGDGAGGTVTIRLQ